MGYEKKPDCFTELTMAVKSRSRMLLPAKVGQLPNKGREGQTYLTFILNHYSELRKYTVFAQGAGIHNGVSVRQTVTRFISSDHIDVEKGQQALYPIVHYNNRTPLLYRDVDEQEVLRQDFASLQGEARQKNSLHLFPYLPKHAIADRARILYVGLFGGTPCDAPPMVFSA